MELITGVQEDEDRIFEAPELITNLGDYERIYGGLDDLDYGTNYLAHAVRNYFNEGGARLYISRVFLPSSTTELGTARSNFLIGAANAASRARFVARFPGSAGNGLISLRLVRTPVTRRIMENALEGTMVQIGGDNPATPAQLLGGKPPFSLPNDSVLLLKVSNADVPAITFHGEAARVVADNPLPDTLDLTAANNTLQVTIDSTIQKITLPTVPPAAPGSVSREDIVDSINSQIRGGFAVLDNTDHLVIGTDKRGTSAKVTVDANATLGFAGQKSAQGSANAANNVSDLAAVTADEINKLLTDTAGTNATAALVPSTGRMVVSTKPTGANATLEVEAPANSANTALGLEPLAAGQQPVKGAAGATLTYFVKGSGGWADKDNAALNFGGVGPGDAPGGGASFLTLTVLAEDGDGNVTVYENLGLDSRHPRWIGRILSPTQTRRSDDLGHLFALEFQNVNAYQLLSALFPTGEEVAVPLTGGNDGSEPRQANYELALSALEKVEDISIVAAPGHSAYQDFQGIQGALITHAENLKAYRIAVLDTPPQQSLSEARTVRSRIDSTKAALYYPWVTVSNPLARPGDESIPREIDLPPSGFVCGVYARSDIQRGVFKAPANEVVRSALRFETDVNFAQQQVLNPLGVNCLRFLSGRGYRVWGARTVSSDPEWKYVNVRRYFIYLESSIDKGTQWAIFEPNGERLWGNIRQTISDFLYNEYVSGALLGSSPKEAFFVRCDRSTMTQNDLDNGRLICLIGVAVIKPAEFVIFRIGQKTADARS
ncbi:MAG: hypothetical protein AUG51_18855 [Acidobacteria bacterium 13_1_20CM_3_53_8]|nr:MAG: hypothetical protein AUG51_18855 [Acidobacteria bacterium 13_1_20CM_3_53_8]